ncbi:hypothetical protein BDR22DRAFT_74563 [Usnea florida]
MALDVKQKLAQCSVQDSSTKQPDQRITHALPSKKSALQLPQQRKRQKKSAHIASRNARGVGSGCAVGPSSAFPISQPRNNPTVQSAAKFSNSSIQDFGPSLRQGNQCLEVVTSSASFGCQKKRSTPFVSSLDNHDKRDNNKISTTPRTSTLSTLPDPYLPPPDCDNSSLWQEIMAKNGAKGTAGYGKLLEMVTGRELQTIPKYYGKGPSQYFSGILDNITPVEKFVVTFDEPAAKEFARQLQHWYTPRWRGCTRSKTDLSIWLSQYLFTEKWQVVPEHPKCMTFDQGAIKRRTECSEDRLLGSIIADLPYPLPAATDLQGRCGAVYGLDSACLPRRSVIPKTLSCYDSAAGLSCIWLRVEYEIGELDHSKTVARHQWAIGAYLELLDRVRLNRPKKNGYLRDAGALSNIRQYGYVVCGRDVEVWVMKVKIHKDSPNQPDRRDRFVFPSRLITTFDLTYHKDVVLFSQWHQSIMTWGLNKYAQDYVDTLEALYSAEIKPKDWLLGYADALGQELPQVVRDKFNETATSIDPDTVQKSRDEFAKSSPSIEGLENAACDDKNHRLPPSPALTFEKFTKNGQPRCQSQRAKQKAEQCPNQSKKDKPYCGNHGKKNR